MNKMLEIFQEARSASLTDLRKFGIVFATVLALVFYVLVPWLRSVERPAQVLFFSLVFFILAAAAPSFLKPVYITAMLFSRVLGAVNNRIILSVIYFMVFTPMALAMRIFSKADPMQAGFEPKLKTYRILRENADLIKNKEKVF